MKITYYFALLILLVSCTTRDKAQLEAESNTQGDTCLQSSKRVIKPQDSISYIKKVVSHINTIKLDSRHVEFMCDEKTKVDRFYEDGKIVKISVDFGWIGDAHAKEDYYYDNGKLIFMYEFVEGGLTCEGCIKKHEYRYYINNGKVFKHLKDKNVTQCSKCEFGPKSRQMKLLTAENKEQIIGIVCR